MRNFLTDIIIHIAAWAVIGYIFIVQVGLPTEMVLSIILPIMVIWLLLSFTKMFRWFFVFAPVVVSYIMFAFYDWPRDTVEAGFAGTVILFVLTGLQQMFGGRRQRKLEKEEDREFERLKRRRESRIR